MRKKDSLIESFDDKFGVGVVYRFEGGKFEVRPALRTTSIALNSILRIGGFPLGMMAEIYGKEGGGKSSLCMDIIGHAQKDGKKAAYIDLEHGFDPGYASRLGVNLSELYFTQPNYGEKTFDIIEMMVKSQIDVIVVDSVASVIAKAETEGEMDDAHVAASARVVTKGLRRLLDMIDGRHKTAILFINQLRDVIGAVGPGAAKTKTTGGRALRHLCSLRIEVSRIAQIKDGDRVIGGRTRAYINKSRICSPYQSAEFDLIYGHGISKETDLIDMALVNGIFVKEKNTIMWGEHKIGIGREKARQFLVENPKAFEQLYPIVLKKAHEAQENLHRAESK